MTNPSQNRIDARAIQLRLGLLAPTDISEMIAIAEDIERLASRVRHSDPLNSIQLRAAALALRVRERSLVEQNMGWVTPLLKGLSNGQQTPPS